MESQRIYLRMLRAELEVVLGLTKKSLRWLLGGRKSPQGLQCLHHRPKLAPDDEKNIKKNYRKKGELFLRCIKKTSVTHNSHGVILMEKVLSGGHKRVREKTDGRQSVSYKTLLCVIYEGHCERRQ